MIALGPRVADARRLGGVAGDVHDLVVTGGLHDQPGGRVAGLAGVEEAFGNRGADAGFQRIAAIGEDEVGGLPAQFQRDALDGVGGGLGDGYARARGPGEGDHREARVPGERIAHLRARAVDQGEGARRHTRVVQDFRVDLCGEGRVLRRFEDRRAAGRQRRKDLERDLVDRPVPRRDEAHRPDRFAQERVAVRERPALFLRLKSLDEAVRVADPGLGLHLARHGDRYAHLERNRLREVFEPRLRALPDAAQKGEAVGLGPAAEVVEGLARGLHGAVHVGKGAKRHRADLFIHGWVHDRHAVAGLRRDPFPADVEVVCVHGTALTISYPSSSGSSSTRTVGNPSARMLRPVASSSRSMILSDCARSP
jgi:hypothetical protein